MKIKCKNCPDYIQSDDIIDGLFFHVETHSIFCKTKQGQTIGTYATPEDDNE